MEKIDSYGTKIEFVSSKDTPYWIMIMRKTLILCAPDPNTNPRPNRMIRWLESTCDLTVVGGEKLQLQGVRSFSLYNEKKTAQNRFINILLYFFYLLSQQHEDILWKKYSRAKEIEVELVKEDFDLIISHDLVLLPLAFKIRGKKNTKIMLDAREYYPLNFNDSLAWRLLIKPFNEHLCKKYLHQCDKIITVSDGLAKEYAQTFNIPEPDIVMSLPTSHDIEPSSVEAEKIQIIHHGNANTSRQTKVMIEMMDFLDERFTLDLMLVNKKTDPYWKKLKKMANQRDNVRLIPSVSMQEIVSFTNAYDIGLFLLPPRNFNLKYALPNKLFEFIQARLLVAIGPNIEMKKIVNKYDCGIIAKDFEPQSLAEELRRLTSEKIIYFKQQSHKAAQELNADTNQKKILEMLDKLLEE